MARVDYNRMAATYDAGRGLAMEGLAAWRAAVEPHLAGCAAPLLDLGAGTGQWAYAFSAWFGARVIAVEPAAGMREAGCAKGGDLRVAWVGGTGGRLPLRAASCGAAWLSTVIHHIPDLPAAAHDLRRLLVPGAPVLIRGSFPGRHEGITLFRYFPGAARVVSTFPTVLETVQAFATAGFAMEALESVSQVSAPSLAVFRERVVHRADTTLRDLEDDQFAAGLAGDGDAIAAAPEPRPVVDRLDLLVLR